VNKFAIAAAAAVAMAGLTASAKAEITTLEIIFVTADENGDFALSKGEILKTAIEQFGIADANGDQMIDAEEAGDLADDPEFSDNDTNDDGVISIEEMVEEKLTDFAGIDGDSDGFLSLEELQAAYPEQ